MTGGFYLEQIKVDIYAKDKLTVGLVVTEQIKFDQCDVLDIDNKDIDRWIGRRQ